MKCQSCGAETAPSRARCEYCDAPLQEARALEVQWTARGRDGVAGRGRVAVVAAPDFTAEQLRAKAEAAFAAALDATGTSAGTGSGASGTGADQVSAAMRERLEAMLGPGVQLQACEVQALTAGPLSPPPAGGMVCRVFAALLLLTIAVCSGFCGLGAWFAGSQAAERAARVRQAQVMKIPEAREARGLVCVETHRPMVDAPLMVGEVPCLKVDRPETKKEQEHVSGFRLNRLEVVVDPDTLFEPLAEVGKEKGVSLHGFRADQDVTVVGEAKEGVLHADVVTALSSREKLLAKLEGDASSGRMMGMVLPVFAVLALVVAGVLLLRRGGRS